MAFTVTDIAIHNPLDSDVVFPVDSTVVIGVNEIEPLGQNDTHTTHTALGQNDTATQNNTFPPFLLLGRVPFSHTGNRGLNH